MASLALNQTMFSAAPSAHIQADFYAKLARLTQDIVTGRHPRHTISKQIIEQFGLAPPAASDASQHAAARALPNGSASKHALPNPSTPSVALPSPHGAARLPQAQFSRATPTKLSAIDPVLLTKSDDLVRAENHLKRLRIDKHLKDEAQSNKGRSGERDNGGWNGAHTFSSTDILDAALSRVKPVSGLQAPPANGDELASSTPNTNSYYSSQAWSPGQRRELEGAEPLDAASFEDVYDEPARRQPRVSGLGPARSAVIDVPREDSYSPPSADSLFPADNRMRESESYSPPPAAPERHQPPQPPHPPPQASHQRQPLQSNNTQAQRNPGSTRWTAKQKKAQKNAVKATRNENDRTGPSGPRPNERKRKRDDNLRPATAIMTRPESPIPYIKSEPLSPPPPSAGRLPEAPRRLVLRDDGTADIEVDAPPATRRRITRDDMDLRRVASMHNARRAPSPVRQPQDVFYQDHILPPTTTSQQLATQAHVRYYHPDEQPVASPHFLRERHSSPMLAPQHYSPRSMMPPPPPAPMPRKIVVDQYGNEYIAVPAGSSLRHSVALESEYLESPRLDRQSFFEQTPRYQQPVYAQGPRQATRQPPEVIELDDSDEQQMPPPRLVPRRQRPVANEPFLQQQQQHPVFYHPQPQPLHQPPPAQRAMSMQPVQQSAQRQYGYPPTPSPYVAPPPYVQQQVSPLYERALSARPNLGQQGGYSTGVYGDEYGIRNEYRRM